MLEIYKPLYDDLWFKQLMMADEETMSYNHAYGGTIPFPKEKWEKWYERWIINNTNERYYRYLIDSNKQFIGEIAYHYDDEIKAYQCDVVIYAKYRNKGYGKQALNLLCKIAKGNGISCLYDEIAIDNPSIKLFLGLGFIEVSRNEKAIMVKKEL